MKKYFFIAVAFLSLLTFNACSSDSPEEELPPKEEPEQPDTPVDPDNPSTSDNVVLAENTILLTDSIDKYVTNPVTGTTLNLETSIDETELPEVGQVLLYGNVSEKFPLGFLGKVKDVVKSSSGYEVITEPVSLEEAFDKLYINETIALTSDEESQQNSRSTEFVFSPWHPQGYTGLECRWHTDFPIVPNIEGGWEVGSISGSLSGSVDGGLAMGANLLCLIDIDKQALKESYIKIAMGLRTSFGNKINLKGELTGEYTKELKKFELAKPFMLSLQGAAIHIILHPAIVLSAFMKYEGKMELDFSQYADYEWEAVYLYEHGIGGLSVNKKDDKDNRTTVNKFSVDGLIDMGLSADFSMAFFNNENVACNFKIAAGPSLAAKLSYDGTEENLYEKLKDNEISIAACKIAVNAGVQISIFKEDNIEVGVDDEELPSFEYEGFFGKKEYYLFPEFKEKNALWKSGNQILAEYDVSRDLLFPVQLGMRLMDKDKRTLKDDVDLVEYQYEKESQTLLSTTFGNVNSKKDYYVCPIVELPLFGKVAASPVTKIEAKPDTCHIDFTIEYPKFSDSYRMNGRDEVSCDAALYPIYENENQRKGIVGTEAILYKDGKEVARSSYQWLGRNIISKLFKREELLIDYENYIARPKDGRWQVSMAFKKLDEYGDTITCVTDVVKDIDLKYDTKPAMIIYRCDIRGCDSHSMEDEHSFLIDMNCFVRGTFWCKTTIGNGFNEVTNGEVIVVRDDFSFGGSWGVNYTNYDVPNRLVMKYIDYSGRMVESNSVPIQTDVNGCVIDSHYEDDSELSQYESRWSFD